MLTQQGCPHCESAKEILKDPIRSGQIEVVPIETQKGKELVKRYDIKGTPMMLNGKDDKFQKCYLTKTAKTMYCEDNREKRLV